MKRTLSVVATALLSLTALPAGAQEEPTTISDWLSGNVALTSDYTFRGISQTLQQPALQGGIDLRHPGGLYLGTWGSSVNFGEDLAGGTARSARARRVRWLRVQPAPDRDLRRRRHLLHVSRRRWRAEL